MTESSLSPAAATGLELKIGHAVNWHEPGLPSFLEDQPHAYATREVVSAPNVETMRSNLEIAPWQEMRGVALSIMADAALMVGCDAFEIRYVASPSAAGTARIQMFITAKSRDWQTIAAESAVSSACNKLPKGFTWSTPERNLNFGPPSPDDVILELRRDEEVTIPQWDYVPADFYYTINDDPGDGSGWPGFWKTLANCSEIVTVSILVQRTEVHPIERNSLGSIITELALYSEPRTDYDIFNNPIYYPACMNAKIALESWKNRIDKLNRPLLARLAVRGELANSVKIATALATAIGTSTGTTGSHPMYIQVPSTESDHRQAAFSFDWLEVLPWGGHGIWDDEKAPMTLRRLPYLFGLNEAASLLVLPVPDTQGVEGIPRSRHVEAMRENLKIGSYPETSIQLGYSMHHGEFGGVVNLPLSAINRHALVVGAPGSGKTTTVLTILFQLWKDHKVPFMVIESVKAEYRSLLGMSGLDELLVITLGNEGLSPLRLNPLEPPPGVRCEVHVGAVMASLKMALPLFPPQPQILAKALSRTYYRAGWMDNTTISDGIAPPTLRDLLVHYREVFAEIGYEGEARNIGLGFQTRLESLLQGSRGRLLDTVRSSDFTYLLNRPVIFELNDIQDPDEKAMIAAFILDRIRAGAINRGGSSGQLKHVTVIEEAHRLLSKSNLGGTGGFSGDQTRADSVRAFCEAIAELRSFGEGFILSSQTPSVLADAAIANAGTRILHRTESAMDRKIMLDDLDADEEVRNASSRLRQGEALARWPERDEVEVLKVVPAAEINSARIVSNEMVFERASEYRRQISRILPYQLCTLEVCVGGCQSRIRVLGARLASDVSAQAHHLWANAVSARREAVEPLSKILAEGAEFDLQTSYCSAVHLSLEGDAFRVTPGIDDRPKLIQAMKKAVSADEP